MHGDLDGRIGDGWGGEAGANGAHVNVVLARRGTPTAASLLGTFTHPGPGHTPILVVVRGPRPGGRAGASREPGRGDEPVLRGLVVGLPGEVH
jgi:hypothetical protein